MGWALSQLFRKEYHMIKEIWQIDISPAEPHPCILRKNSTEVIEYEILSGSKSTDSQLVSRFYSKNSQYLNSWLVHQNMTQKNSLELQNGGPRADVGEYCSCGKFLTQHVKYLAKLLFEWTTQKQYLSNTMIIQISMLHSLSSITFFFNGARIIRKLAIDKIRQCCLNHSRILKDSRITHDNDYINGIAAGITQAIHETWKFHLVHYIPCVRHTDLLDFECFQDLLIYHFPVVREIRQSE